MSTQFVLTVVAFAALLGFGIGCFVGYSRGHPAGWLDHYFETAEKDRARRDKLGRFKKVEGAK